MMTDFWDSNYVKKSRKDHVCEFCYGKILQSSSCYHEHGKYDGEFQDYYLCERCRELVDSRDERWEWHESGELGEFHELFIDGGYIKCPKCGSNNYDKIDYSKDALSCTISCDNCDNEYKLNLSAENLLGQNK
jgi:DNA-directed RNA polymerase subunit RPC12/RpoP